MVTIGMRQANSTNVQDVIRALEGWQGATIVGDTQVTARNHQTIRPYFVLKCKQESAMEHELDFANIIHTDATPQPEELNECEDIGAL